MLDLLNAVQFLLPFGLAGVIAGDLTIAPVTGKPRRLRFHKRGGMWFFRVGKFGGSFYLSSK